MTFGRHFMTVCKYGYVHRQCRCPDKNKAVLPVNCSLVEHQKNPKSDGLAKQMETNEQA